MGVAAGLVRFNAMPADEAEVTLLRCCDVPGWAARVRRGRPYSDLDAALSVADSAASTLSRDDVDRALAAHPRIGERAEGETVQARWSRAEQSGVGPDGETARALADGNRAYEERFGRVFLICATGLGAEEILAALHTRLGNDDDKEQQVVADELRKITLTRLRKVLTV
ncbi:MAG: 2-oxo-4-hydroxy-4-carboxy-5-ureidoimidazoline decarboxylase [Propionibacteriales bacterium]|nr:2-oxo-4-hydroxy-4-carboxy-5-ureidoimidazoline decarboxylase [Propionibacteriales bacterium]